MTTTRRNSKSSGDMVLATGLSVAACLGLVGVIGIREAAAADTSAAESSAEATTTVGYSQAELDAYASALQDQATQLADYRAQLDEVAAQLNLRIALAQPAPVTAQQVAAQAPAAQSGKKQDKPRNRKPAKPQQPKTTTQSS